MSTKCFLNFPASEQKAATDSILYAVAKYVINKFPQRVIKQLFVDLQDNMRDIYKNALSSYSGALPTSSNGEELLKAKLIDRTDFFKNFNDIILKFIRFL